MEENIIEIPGIRLVLIVFLLDEIVILLFTPEQAPYILSQPLHSSQKILSNDDRGLKIELKVYRSHELVQSILGYGDRVKVVKPAGLRKEIITTLKANLKQYQ